MPTVSGNGWVKRVARGIEGDVLIFRQTYHPNRGGLMGTAAFVAQPSSGALLLMRVAAEAPRAVSLGARRRLMRKFACDVERGAVLTPGLLLAHAVGIVIGGSVETACGVKLHQHVTLGVDRGGCPRVGEGVYIYPGAVVVGPIAIGRGAAIGANSFVSVDVAPGAVVRGGNHLTKADELHDARSPDG